MGRRTESGWRWRESDGSEYEEDNNGNIWDLSKQLDDESENPQEG